MDGPCRRTTAYVGALHGVAPVDSCKREPGSHPYLKFAVHKARRPIRERSPNCGKITLGCSFAPKRWRAPIALQGLIGPLAPKASGRERETVQSLTLAALRALGVADARARGLVVQTTLPAYGDAAEQSS